MKILICLCIMCWGMIYGAEAQMLKGKITDKNGMGIPGATLYLREIAAGSVADENGDFQIGLPVGDYTCEISALGYEKQIKPLRVKAAETLRMDIQLKEMSYMLKEVKVSRSKEDPACYFMRHAIARAPFHLNQVKSYQAEIYTKGNMQLEKIPKLLMLSKEMRKEVGPYIGKLFLLESVTDLKFEAPDKYERKILAFSSTIPSDMSAEDALDVVSASVYEPEVMGLISPLSPVAFSYYRFHLEDYYEEGGRNIAKIKVIPRKDNRLLVSGWLHIAEKDWSVVRFDLEMVNMGITAGIKCVYHEVKPTVFLPTSYDIDVKLKILGIRAGGKYYAAVKYKEVDALSPKVTEYIDTVVPALDKPAVASVKQTGRKRSKEEKMRKQLEELSEKDNLTTREAYRIARMSQQLFEPKRPDTLAPLEVRELSVQVKTRVDTMAMQRDSLYWLQMRTIPLKKEEVVSYQKRDSFRKVVKSLQNTSDTLHRSSGQNTGDMILLGGNLRLRKNVSLSVSGLIRAVPEYNFADGFWIGQKLSLKIRMKRNRQLTLSPSFYFATARKTMLWEMKGKYIYSPMRQGRLNVEMGYLSADYKGHSGSLRLENAMTSLFYADNFMKFYSKRYVSFRNSIDIANGLKIEVDGRYEKRRILQNHITYNFFKKDAEPNLPSLEGGVDMPDNTALVFGANLSFTPRYNYRVRNGIKDYLYSAWPTFSMAYQRGIPLNDKHTSSFERLQFGVLQSVELGYFDKLSYWGQAGKYLSGKEIYFPDYKHFATTGWILNTDGFESGFMLADYYRLNTDDKWVYAGINYKSEYLLLKRLPFLQRYLFNEGLHVRYLWTPALRHYVETGYSLGFYEALRIGVFAGFDRKGYEGVGFRISFLLTD